MSRLRMGFLWMTCISSVCVLLLGCSDGHGRADQSHDDHDGHDFKSYSVGNYFQPCPGGIHENGDPLSKEVADHLQRRDVHIPEEAFNDALGKDRVFYSVVALPNDESEVQSAIVGCSPDLREVVAWACEKDKTFDGALCELEFSEGGVPMNDSCVQTNMAVSGFVTKCVF